MPIILDDSLHESLYPLAWLVGSWEGEGAIHVAGQDGEGQGRAIEQHLSVTTREHSLVWHMRTWVLDAPAPPPPTSAFYSEPPPAAPGKSIRELILEERGTWTSRGLVPGQNEAAAKAAQPGTAESYLSYGLDVEITRTAGYGSPTTEQWAGEVRGPRIQLASRSITVGVGQPVHATRMFGLVGGSLMWLQEIGDNLRDTTPYLSIELHRSLDTAADDDGVAR